ncbi:MAG: efflux RND transporter periplasmic adaptor subunit [Aestuariibacter sp.]
MSGHLLTRVTTRHPTVVLAVAILVPTFLLVILLKSAGAGQTPGAPKTMEVQRVEVLQIKHQDQYHRKVNIVGRVESGEQTVLGFERGGTVARTLFDEGQPVTAGQLLAELDMQRLNAQMQEVEATITRAKADARLAQLSQRRIKKLVADKMESPQRLDEARESTLAAMALVDEMQARRVSIEVEFEKSRLYAPFDGVLIGRQVDTGSVVAQGQPIFSLLRNDALQVRMAMSADDAFRFSIGQQQTLYKNDTDFQATVLSIGANRHIQTRTVDVMLALSENAKSQLLQGDLLSLELQKQISASGFWLPKSALTSSIRGLWSVFSVSQPGDEQKVKARNVNVLYSDRDKVFVSGSLTDQDYIVASGVHRLVPEQLVKAVENNDALIAGDW